MTQSGHSSVKVRFGAGAAAKRSRAKKQAIAIGLSEAARRLGQFAK
jgi:hypothetical protein